MAAPAAWACRQARPRPESGRRRGRTRNALAGQERAARRRYGQAACAGFLPLRIPSHPKRFELPQPVVQNCVLFNESRFGRGDVPMQTNYRPGETDTRPWGRWTVLDAGPGFAVKRIEVTPGGRLSLQRHRHRAEQWTIVGGTAQVTLGDRTFEVPRGGTVAIAQGQVHRIENRGGADVVFIEVQMGEVLDENDIERLEDVYGRS
jgi:mannose-6-phosphate isomerase-like protein (cupin superfamily)